MRRQLELSNEAATALSDPNGAIVAELRRHINSQFHLRGKLVTLEGDDDAVAALIARVRDLCERLGVEVRLSKLGVTRAAVPELLALASGNSLRSNPREFAPGELAELLAEAL